MEVEYLEPPTLEVDEPGWYVTEGDRVCAGPYTKARAEIWLHNNSPKKPGM